LDAYVKKQVAHTEAATNPVIIVPPKKYASLMIQTDPDPDENATVEPNNSAMPLEHWFD